MRTSVPVGAECTEYGSAGPARHGQGPEAGVAPQAPSRTGRIQMRPSRLSCVARCPVGVRRTLTGQSLLRARNGLCCHPQVQDAGPVVRANARRGLRPSSRRLLSGSPRCVRACAQHLTATLRIIPYSAFAQQASCRVPPCPPSDGPLSGARAHKHRRPELRSTELTASGYCGGPHGACARHASSRPTAAWRMGMWAVRAVCRARIRMHVENVLR
jgi:hypothetical protein